MGKTGVAVGASALWLIGLLLGLLLLPLGLVLSLCRLFVTRVLRPLFRGRDLIEPLVGLDVGFCSDRFCTEPKAGIAFVHLLSGRLDPDSLKQRIQSVLHSKAGDYSRLTSVYPQFWLGYPFWKSVQPGSFQLENHIRVRSEEESNELNAIVADWIRSPFRAEAPLWDVLLFPDWKGGSVFGFRIQHTLGDGYSMLQFLNMVFDSPEVPKPKMSGPKALRLGARLCSSARVMFWMPFSTFQFLRAFYFHSDYFSRPKQGQQVNLGTTTTSLSELKRVRLCMSQKLGRNVSFLNAVLHLVGSGLRKFLVQDVKGKSLPEKLFLVTSLPMSSEPHPEGTFCNHWRHGTFEIPISEPNGLSRLRALQSYSDFQYRIQAPEISSHFAQLCSLLPRPLLEQLSGTVMGTSLGLANLPGPSGPKSLCGLQIETKLAVVGLILEHAGIALGVFSYNGQVSITMMANQDVIPSSELNCRILNDYLQEEMSIWLQESSEDSLV